MESRTPRHDPVMLAEIMELLPLRPGAVVVDGTLGLAGHSLEFARRIASGGVLIGFDWDESMLQIAQSRLQAVEGVRVELRHANFREIKPTLDELGLRADGILLDLGLNSAQLDDPERGISFLQSGPLDMRMDRSQGETAASLLNRLSLGEIEQILWDYGDERWARNIARKILERRKSQPLRTTTDLVECVQAAIPVGARDKRIHPATRTFQAVRIYVNQELDDLDQALRDAAESLAPGGVLAVLAYHSGEDRIVKQVFRDLDGQKYEDLFRKPRTATEREERENPRSRSAKLRGLRRL
jgi:16S rRNA (cytosine1402-N4)-methyltransferase